MKEATFQSTCSSLCGSRLTAAAERKDLKTPTWDSSPNWSSASALYCGSVLISRLNRLSTVVDLNLFLRFSSLSALVLSWASRAAATRLRPDSTLLPELGSTFSVAAVVAVLLLSSAACPAPVMYTPICEVLNDSVIGEAVSAAATPRPETLTGWNKRGVFRSFFISIVQMPREASTPSMSYHSM